MGNLKIGRMTIGSYGTNCYFIYREGGSEAIVVDPADQGEMICEKLKANGFEVKGILLTHAHFDHIWGAEALRKASGAKIYAAEDERKLCESPRANVSEWAGRPCTIAPDVYVKDGEEIGIAGMTCKVLVTPGHTVGSSCYYFEEGEFLVCGDTIFQESVGRTDFPSGSSSALVRSVKEKIFTLPDQTRLYPGHGDSTSVEHEKKYNPFCQ